MISMREAYELVTIVRLCVLSRRLTGSIHDPATGNGEITLNNEVVPHCQGRSWRIRQETITFMGI